MRIPPRVFNLFIVIFLLPALANGQYVLVGAANAESCNCFKLTTNVTFTTGAVWSPTKIDLTNPFDFTFNIYLGCKDINGADGMAFVLQTNNNNVGSFGQGLGYEGINQSIAVTLDTYANIDSLEPGYDHISIQKNGSVKHPDDLTAPMSASSISDDIEDCLWHKLRISWDPVTKTISTWFDDVARVSAQHDIVANMFNNNPLVYWGFTAATGSVSNIQKICKPAVAEFSTGLIYNATCAGNNISFKDSSSSYTTINSFFWDFGDGTTSTLQNPQHVYTQDGVYNVTHSFTAEDGCMSPVITKVITVGDNPVVSFKVFDTCETNQARIELNTSINTGQPDMWKWDLDGAVFSTDTVPDFSGVSAGNHSLALTLTSNYGCVSNTYTTSFNLKSSPKITIMANDGCVDIPIAFSGSQNDPNTTISSWSWDFGDGSSSNGMNASHTFSESKIYPVTLKALATNGCESSEIKDIFINEALANAGNDTLIIKNSPFQLQGSGGDYYTWSPSFGLDNPNVANPNGSWVDDDITYHLDVSTVEGCVGYSSVKVSIFKGSAVFVPNAFTPNGDGRNDILKPYFIGINKFSFFKIYDRFGKNIFSANKMDDGWDGSFHGKMADGGVYVFILKATDLIGKVYELKGSVILIK